MEGLVIGLFCVLKWVLLVNKESQVSLFVHRKKRAMHSVTVSVVQERKR